MGRSRSLPPDLRDRPFGVAEARAHGLTPGRLRGSDLARPFRGVRVSEAPTTHIDECRAYAARMRPGEFFSHASAVRAHGLPLPWRRARGPIHVTAVLPEGRPRGAGVHGHSIAPSLARVATVRGLKSRIRCRRGASSQPP